MMNNEEVQRNIAFIIDQQARCAVEREKLFEAQHLTEQRFQLVTEKLQETNDVVTRLAYVTNAGFKDVSAKIDALVDSHIALENSHKQLDETLSARINALIDSHVELRASQKQTDEQLKQTGDEVHKLSVTVDKLSVTVDKLSVTVDRYIRRRNGG